MKRIGLILAVAGLAFFTFTGRAMAVWDVTVLYLGDTTGLNTTTGTESNSSYSWTANWDFIYEVSLTSDVGAGGDVRLFRVENPFAFPITKTALIPTGWGWAPLDGVAGDPTTTFYAQWNWNGATLSDKLNNGETFYYAFTVSATDYPNLVIGNVGYKAQDSGIYGETGTTSGPVPEPTSLLLLGGGLLGVALLGVARRRKIAV